MTRSKRKEKEEARKLYLGGEMTTNAEIAVRLGVKAHTVARWRREEGWDDLRLKIDRRAAELFVEKIATDRTSLNVRHYRMWDLVLAEGMEILKKKDFDHIRELDRLAGIIDRAQKGQRLAKGLSLSGETEEQIRAEAEAENRRLIDVFIDSVKQHVPDEIARDAIRRALMDAFPEEDEAA